MKDYYAVLGIRRFTTDQNEIRQAYLNQMRFFHPDAGNVSPEIALVKSQELNGVYSVLADSQLKDQYDLNLLRALEAERVQQNAKYDLGFIQRAAKAGMTPEQYEQYLQQRRDWESQKKDGETSRRPVTSKSYKSGISPGAKVLNIFYGLVAVIALFWLVTSRTSDKLDVEEKSHSNTVAETVSSPQLQEQRSYNGMIIHSPTVKAIAPLTVETSGSNSYYVVLKCIECDADEVSYQSRKNERLCKRRDISFFVSAGKTAEVDVPLGKYEIYYATGETWYGEDYLFGPTTQRYKCDDTFIFEINGDYVEGWTLTLYAVYNGNMDSDPVSEADFPDLGVNT